MNVGLSYPCRGFDFHNQDFYFLLVLEVVGDPCKPGRGGQPKMNVSLSKNQTDQFWLKPIETGWNSCVQRCSVSPFMGAMFLSQTATSSAPGNPPFWVLKWHSFNRKKKQESRWIKRLFAWSMFLEATCNDLFLRSSVFKKREFLSWWLWQLEYESGRITAWLFSFPTKLLHCLAEKSPKNAWKPNPSTNRQTPTNSGRPQLGMQFGNLIHQKLLFHDLGKLVKEITPDSKVASDSIYVSMYWNYPPPSNSHHQDYSIFSRESL